MATNRSDDFDDLDLDGALGDLGDEPGAAFMKEELRAGAHQDLAAAAFLWTRRPRQARLLLQRAADVLGWLSETGSPA